MRSVSSRRGLIRTSPQGPLVVPPRAPEGERTARSLPDRGSCEENVTAAYSVPFVRMEAPDAHPDQGGRVGGRRRDAGRGDAAGATARGRRERTHVAAGGA